MIELKSKEFPEDVGTYLFYGKRFEDDDELKLYVVYVHKTSNNHLVYVCNDNFMFISEKPDGYFSDKLEFDIKGK